MSFEGKTSRGRVYIKRTLAERFWLKVNKNGPIPERCPELGQCHLWLGALNSSGYGQIVGEDGKKVSSHVAAWKLAGHEPLEPGQELCHHCDVRRCVNEAHLFPGTRSDNMRDAAAKGRLFQQTHREALRRGDDHWTRAMPERIARGARQGRASITDDTVRSIRKAKARGDRIADIAAKLGISRKVVEDVVRLRTWRHVS